MAIPQLVLGGFNMTDWAGVTYGTSVIAEGTSKGAPVPLEVAVKSWLQDGSVVVTQGYDNREVNLRVKFRAPSLTAVAQAEAAFFAELGKPNTLTWTPASGPASVFVVVTSSMQESPSEVNDLVENQAFPWRTYNVRLVCEAFVRSVSEVVAAALPATGTTTTLVNAGSATTGWTGLFDGASATPTVVSGAVRATGTSNPFVQATNRVSLSLTAAITTSTTKYIQVDWKPESTTGSPQIHAYGDATELTKVAESASPTPGFTRTWFGPVAASSIAVLKLEAVSTAGTDFYGGTATRSIYVDNVNRTDVKPSFGTGRQLLRSIDVAGSAPTQGSLAIEHASASLGDVLAYFFPDADDANGYSPSLRQYYVSGGTVTPDSTLVSGSRQPLNTPAVFDIPVSRLPSGMHTFMVRAKTNTFSTASFSWTAQLRVNSTNVGSAVSGSATVDTTGSLGSSQTFYTLGRMVLPPTDVDPTSATAVVRLTLSEPTLTLEFDEGWLFSEIGQLIQVGCGTAAPASGGSANRVFIEPASTGRPRPTVRIGFAADRSDSFAPNTLKAWQSPRVLPPRLNVLTVTTNALDASVTLRHYPRWHTNAAS